MLNTNFLCGGGLQQLQVVSLVARNTPGQQDGIGPGVRLDKAYDAILLLLGEGVVWQPLAVAVLPCRQTANLVVILEALESCFS